MSLRINFFGGPGVGKSTLAAQLFGWLKAENFDAELVQEFVKTWAYQGRQLKSFDHVFTFASQLHTEDLFLQSGVNMVVTDSPILLQVMYQYMKNLPGHVEMKHLAGVFEDQHPSINFLVDRQVEYKPQGRYQTAEAAAAIHADIVHYLDDWRVPFTKVDPGDLKAVLDKLDYEYGIRRTRVYGGLAEQDVKVLKAMFDLHKEHGSDSFFTTHQIWLLTELAGNLVWKTCNRLANRGRLIRGEPTSDGETFAIPVAEINIESFLNP